MQVTSLKYLTLITIFLSFLGEYIAIFLRPGSVSDWWDVVCYFYRNVCILLNYKYNS